MGFKRQFRFFATSSMLREAGIYTLSHLAAKAVPFLLLPVLTRYLSPADYGLVSMFMLVATIVDPFIGLALNGSVSVKFFDEEVDLAAYIGTGLAVVAMASVPWVLALLALRHPLSQLTAVPADWLPLVILLVLCRPVSNLVTALWRVQRRPVSYGLFQNLQSAAILGGSLALVVGLGRHWQGRVEAELMATGLSAAVALVYLRRAGWLRWTFVSDYARQMLRFGIPLIPHTLGAVLMAQTDRLFITNMVGVDETGLYTVGYQLALLIELANVSFNNAFSPWLFGKLRSADEPLKQRLVRYTYVYFFGVCLVSLVVALVMPPLAGILLDERFGGSAAYVRWFAVGFACNGMYYAVSNYIFFAEKTGWLALVTFSTALLNVPLTYFLIRVNGGLGAAQATAIALALAFVLTWRFSARAYPMPWSAPLRRRAS